MRFGELLRGEFLERLNRFTCCVRVEGREERALLRNTGRLRELLKKGVEVYLQRKSSGKLPYELKLVKFGEVLVCVDSHLSPKLLAEYLERTGNVSDARFEFKVGRSRFDLLLNNRLLVETKSVNLVRDGVALFPDAPTERGAKHVEELMSLYPSYLPAVVFVVQREDALLFRPNEETDPKFAEVLRRFTERGFTVKAFLCGVSLREIYIKSEIPVEI